VKGLHRSGGIHVEFETADDRVVGQTTGAPALVAGGGALTMANIVRGTQRSDRLVGTDGADRIDGRAGNDLLDGGLGNDLLIGGEGRDTVRFRGKTKAVANLDLTGTQSTGYGIDTIRGVENLSGGSGPDRFVGCAKANALAGNSGNDTLAGGAGDDRLLGGAGDDSLIGGTGHDRLAGGTGHDVMIGGSGDDIYTGSTGNDLYRGDAGSDTVVMGGRVAVKVDLRKTGVQNTGQGLDRFIGIENVTGGSASDVISGNKAANKLSGGSGNDRIYGYGGNDTIAGNAGDDLLDGGDGNDLLIGGAGNDRLIGGAGVDTAEYGHSRTGVRADLAAGTASGDGIDTLTSVENVNGGSGHDTLVGNGDANRLVGGAGNDRLDGGAGNDVLDGGFGDDSLDGGVGDDLIDAGAGADVVTFASGSDRVTTGDGADTVVVGSQATGSLAIMDFTSGQDILDLTSQGPFAKVGGALSGSGVAELAVARNGTSTLLSIDRDGDGKAEVTVQVNGTFDLYKDTRASLPNRAPVAVDDQASTVLETPVRIDVLANDSDPDGHALSLKLIDGPANGAVILNADKTFTYTPKAGWTGTDTFTYQVADGHGGLANATATVKVDPAGQDGYTTQFHVNKTSGYSDGYGGRTFFIDPTSGASGNDGLSEGKAWGSFNDLHAYAYTVGFQAGDRILLKRGCTYDSKDGFWLKGNGTAEKPIVLGAYGNGEPPVLTNSKFAPDPNGQDTSIHDAVLNVDRDASHFTIRDIAIDNPIASNVTEAGIRVFGTHVTVDNVEVAHTGMGISFARNAASGMANADERAFGLVQNSFVHDLTMVINTPGANDDYGCQGVLIGASEVTVRNNTFANLMQSSFDYIWDGAAVELYGTASNIRVQANYIENVNAVTELGGRSGDSVAGVWFDHNIVVNSESLAYFHNGGGDFGLGSIQNVNFTNNTVYGAGNRSDSQSFAFGFGGTDGTFLNVQNNIFAIAGMDYWDFGATNYRHSNNLYDYDVIPFRSGYLGAGEYVGEASFKDAGGRDFHLTTVSQALGRASGLPGYLRDYVGHDLTGRSGLDIGAIEYWN
jgi:Ca2+-binding RTX toxin-like protein